MTLQAIVSDDEMFKTLYLKGGNALDLVCRLHACTSTDLDFSTYRAFSSERVNELRDRFERLLSEMFRPHGYLVFDVRFEEKPENMTTDLEEFLGG